MKWKVTNKKKDPQTLLKLFHENQLNCALVCELGCQAIDVDSTCQLVTKSGKICITIVYLNTKLLWSTGDQA